MSDEARRVFKMETILGLIAGKSGADISDFIGYLAQRELSAEQEGAVAPMAKGWLYSQHPPFMECDFSEGESFDAWAAKEASRLGDNVSIQPIPASEMAGISVVLDAMADAKATIAAQAKELEEAKAQVAELEPFKAQAADLEKKVADLEGNLETAQTDLAGAKKDLKAYDGKVAVDEKDIESSVKDMVSKAVKDALAALPAGAAAGAAVAAGAEESVEEAPAEAASDSVPDDFGFGTSGSDGDGFGF